MEIALNEMKKGKAAEGNGKPNTSGIWNWCLIVKIGNAHAAMTTYSR